MQTLVLHPLISPFSGYSTSKNTGFHRRRRPSNSILALKRDAYDDKNHNGKMVDENMIVLRQRIREMKMAETNEEPPAHWTEWEKRYYNVSYNNDISEAMGFLQYWLMKTRPSLALGMVALVIFSVPTSMVAVALQLMNMAKSIHFT